MSLRINHNISSLVGRDNLAKNNMMLGKSIEKLSSGLRINHASDDAAGLIISEQMRAQIAGTDQATKNSETAVNMVQTAEGALDQVNTLLTKARTLALHSANEGANDQNQLVADQTELDNITSSIDRIASNTQFGTKKLLDGSLTSFRSNSALVGSAQTGNYMAAGLKAGTITKGYHSLVITTTATQGNLFINGGATDIITGNALDEQSGSSQFQKAFTVAVNGVQLAVASGSTKTDFVNALNSLGRTLGFTAAVAASGTTAAAATYLLSGSTGSNTGAIILINKNFGSSSTLSLAFVSGASGATSITSTYTAGADLAGSLLLFSGTAGGTATTGSTAVAVAQSGNSLTLVSTTAGQGFRINLNANLAISGGVNGSGLYAGVIDGNSTGATFQIGANAGQTASVDLASAKAGDLGQGVSSSYKNVGSLTGSLTSGNASEALKVIDQAINDITLQRGKLGAFQANTLESNIASLAVANQNLIASESTIRDVDFAAESANFAKNNILVQSATAMLAQANQLPQSVLKLLG